MLDYDGRTMLERKWVKADKQLFNCYTSKSMALARKRAGVVAKKNLQAETHNDTLHDALRGHGLI
jgi:hypothetical protein